MYRLSSGTTPPSDNPAIKNNINRINAPRETSATNINIRRGKRSASQPAIGDQNRYGRKKKNSIAD